ncbi:MAG: arylamine N-acetyltransferase [Bacteroidota bacterium]
MNIIAYLSRISHHDTPRPDFFGLKKLQQLHLSHIPFENLDIHYENKIELDLEKIFEKLIRNRRGGFCYELNALFHWLLTNCGFEVDMISARVHIEGDKFGPEFDHMALIVHLEGKQFLVDVGFGAFAMGPLLIEENTLISDQSGQFQFHLRDDGYWQVGQVIGEKLVPEYIFSLNKRELADFSEMCHYHQTDSRSHFTQKRVISIPTEEGRITLNDRQLKITREGTSEKIKFETEAEFRTYLSQYFQISL